MQKTKTALLFSGQGAQEQGMGRSLAESDSQVMDLWKKAEKISALPLRGIYWDGGENMDDTRCLQPALTVVNMGLWMSLSRQVSPVAAAGHSLGEYCALAAAAVFSPTQTLELVSLRGRLMAEADPDGRGGMAALLKLEQAQAEEAVRQTLLECGAGEDAVLVIANYNTPSQFVASGSRRAIGLLALKARELKGRAVPLAVSGAFHSSLMDEAAKEMSLIINKCPFAAPRFPVYCNVNGRATRSGEELKALLLRQMTSSVCWIDTVRNLFKDGINLFVECSPKSILSKMVGQILSTPEHENSYASVTVSNADDIASMLREGNYAKTQG